MSQRARLILAAVLVASDATLALAWAGWSLARARTHRLFGRLVTRVEIAG